MGASLLDISSNPTSNESGRTITYTK